MSERTKYLDILDTKLTNSKRQQEQRISNIKKQKFKFDHDSHQLSLSKVDAIELAVEDIMNNVNSSVTKNLNSDLMKRVISSNALQSFTKVCNVKTSDVIE